MEEAERLTQEESLEKGVHPRKMVRESIKHGITTALSFHPRPWEPL